ncbi:MAG: CRISPR system precrRNA processing endoribonuclease RAMP protein Cas6 [Thermodesulfobacteriota bacterium]
MVCCNKIHKTCETCMVRETCAYTLLFNPLQIGGIKRFTNLPRGFVIKPPLDDSTQYTSSNPLRFEMVLVGDRIKVLPFVIIPFKELGGFGIGLNRGKFDLDGIEVLRDGKFDSIYDPVTNIVSNFDSKITGEELIKKADGLDGEEITFCFLTPTRIRYNPTGEKGNSRLIKAPEFHHIIRRLRDRINALTTYYCGGSIGADFSGIAERAMKVRKIKSDLEWIEMRRKSRTQKTIHDQSGFIGKISFEGNIKEFIPLILAGEYLHVGEDVVFGNGWFNIMW